jgi:hypothetical protein
VKTVEQLEADLQQMRRETADYALDPNHNPDQLLKMRRSLRADHSSGSFCQKSRPRLYLIRDYSRRFAFTATFLVDSAKNRTAQAPSNLACAHPG